jgi:signal transduction histidine kinase
MATPLERRAQPLGPYLGGVLLLAALYIGLARLGLRLDAVNNFATLVWPPSGLALAALLVFGPRLWPGVALGAAVANVWTGAPILVALGIALGNTLEAVLGSYAVRRVPGFRVTLDSVPAVLGFVFFAALASPVVSATIGVASLYAAGLVPAAGLATTWSAWWLGDAIGALVVTPFLLTWATNPRPWIVEPARLAEAVALAATLVGMTLYLFSASTATGNAGPFRQPTTLLPLLIWAALRFGVRGATGATLLVAVAAVWSTAVGRGPFVRGELHEGLALLQGFMSVVAVTFLALSAVIAERQRADRDRSELLHRERLARADAEQLARLREETLGIVSDDLRTPVSAMVTASKQLVAAVPDDPARPIAEVVHQTATRMAELINDVLDSATIAAGRLVLDRGQHDAASLLREAVEHCHPAAAWRRVAVIADYGDRPYYVACDRRRIVQALSRILSRACDVTPADGTVRAAVNAVDHSARFSVHDGGASIAPAHTPHVFERFWRVPLHPRAAGAVRLGLYIAKGIVEAHRGKIWLEVSPDLGNTVLFTLPRVHDGERAG